MVDLYTYIIISVKIQNSSGKVDVVLHKATAGQWKNIGKPVGKNNYYTKTIETGMILKILCKLHLTLQGLSDIGEIYLVPSTKCNFNVFQKLCIRSVNWHQGSKLRTTQICIV